MIYAIIAVCALLAGAALVYVLVVPGLKSKLSESEALRRAGQQSLSDAEARYEKTLSELKEVHKESLAQQKESFAMQLSAIKNEMAAENEKLLKQREEELSKKAEETFRTISGGIGKDMEKMTKAFEENKKTQSETSAELKERIVASIKALEDQTNMIGSKADNLASALKGEKKMQGCFGETILGNILESEGMVEGRDYDREDTIRTGLGIVMESEEEKRMRPDFVLHYPDGSDIIVDAKTPINALADYYAAQDDETRADASRRNLEAVMEHVKTLGRKDYAGYSIRAGRKTLDYVIMFIPNYGALQLAKQEKPDIWREAYNKYNVLITTEETFIPFTRMIRTAWISHEQVRNQSQILSAAQNMVDRVHDFAKAHAEMGKKLDDAKKFYDQCDAKLRESGQSIIVSAHQVLKLGVPANPRKPLPDVYGSEEESATE